MHNLQTSAVSLADIPFGLFPDDALAMSTPTPATPVAISMAPALIHSRALKIARAISGETELRLLAEGDNETARYVIASATTAPYAVVREVLVKPGKKKTPFNKTQAVEEFERRVAAAYPPETLRNGKTVAIHLNLI